MLRRLYLGFAGGMSLHQNVFACSERDRQMPMPTQAGQDVAVVASAVSSRHLKEGIYPCREPSKLIEVYVSHVDVERPRHFPELFCSVPVGVRELLLESISPDVERGHLALSFRAPSWELAYSGYIFADSSALVVLRRFFIIFFFFSGHRGFQLCSTCSDSRLCCSLRILRTLLTSMPANGWKQLLRQAACLHVTPTVQRHLSRCELCEP